MRGTQGGSDLGSPTVEAERRSSARFADYFDFEPIHPAADPGSQCLRAGFLSCKARRQTFGGLSFAQAIGLLRGCKYAVKKPRTKPLHRLMNAAYFDQIDSAADDHTKNRVLKA